MDDASRAKLRLLITFYRFGVVNEKYLTDMYKLFNTYDARTGKLQYTKSFSKRKK